MKGKGGRLGVALLLLGALIGPGPAAAAEVTDRPLLGSCDGAGSTAGAFSEVRNLEVEQASGELYVFDIGRKALDKFDANCAPKDFAAPGESSLPVGTSPLFSNGQGDVAIDNSTEFPGRIYATDPIADEWLIGFGPDGARLPWELSREGRDFEKACAAAVDGEGHLWVVDDTSSPKRMLEFDASGVPPAKLGEFPYTNGGTFPCSIDFDAAGNAYIASDAGVFKYAKSGEGKYAYSSTLDPEPSGGVAVDRASGHVFVSHSESFSEYDAAGTPIGSFGKGVISNGVGIAVNGEGQGGVAPGTVYVANFSGPKVYVFGTEVKNGTVPDVTAKEASEEGVSRARLNGTIDPNGVANEYFFEWKPGTRYENWGAAESNEDEGLSIDPPDSKDHEVSLEIDKLTGNTTYQARLVGVNTENGLRQVSAPVTFTTLKAPGPPEVEIDPPSGITGTAAQVSGAVNPREDFSTRWWLETAEVKETEEGPKCAGFSKGPVHAEEAKTPKEVEEWESNSPIAVEEPLTGLLPSQRYCVRIAAKNSFNAKESDEASKSKIEEFSTLPIAPDEVVTAFAAPRTETTARINAYANPEGETLSYRFEYSKDGGASWIDLGEHEDTSEARQPRLFAAELGGLEPATEYSYRFSAENAADEGAPAQGAVKTFTTRTEAEAKAVDPPSCPNEEVRTNRGFAYLPECRGAELVNNPDDGNQNVGASITQGTPPLSPEGERALWNVNGGAPGGNSGFGATFLARRSGPSEAAPNGWESRSLIPPAAQQVEAERGGYLLGATTPSLGGFVFATGTSIGSGGGRTLVRVDAEGNQDVLREYPKPNQDSSNAELSADGAHVLRVESPGGASATVAVTEGSKTVEVEPGSASGLFIAGRPATTEGYFPLETEIVECTPSCTEPKELELSNPAEKSGAEVALEMHPQLEDVGTPGEPETVSYLPDGTLPECGIDPEGGGFIGGDPAVGGAGGQWRPGDHLIATTDASRVYFQVHPNGKCGIYEPWWLLERDRAAEGGQGKTLALAPPDPSNALIRATPDGRSAYFVSRLALEPTDTNEHVDVYRWDEETEEDSCLTCAMENEAGEAVADANLRMLRIGPAPVLVSEDLSHLYFESEAKLAPEASAVEANVYALAAGRVRFVATPGGGSSETALGHGPGTGEAELSGDGSVLVFETSGAGNLELTADRLAASCPNPQTGGPGPCREIFRYDDREGSLECLSCLHGATTTSSAETRIGGNAFRVAGDGETVAFASSQALAPGDVNHGLDLYEWRYGERRLITDGRGDFAQRGNGALRPYALSEHGRDILFEVADPGLTGFEQNRFANLYDARIDGGFEPPPPVGVCSEESCQGPLREPPPFESPGSALIEGAGNVEEAAPKPRCAKGRVRRHGRCVRRHTHRRRHRRVARAKHGRAR